MSHLQILRRAFLPGSLALLIFLGSGLVNPTAAQMTDRRWEFGFALGSANLDSSSEDFDLDLRVDLRGGYIFSDRFELEAQLMSASAVLDASLNALMANAIFSFRPDERVVPYVLVGIGHSEIDDITLFGTEPDVSEGSAAFQIGVGSRFFVGAKRRMAVRLELSSLSIDTDLFESDRHTSLTAGLTWASGTPGPPKSGDGDGR